MIEHIQNPEELLANCISHLKHDAIVIVSVPTPLYPKFFGRKFHYSIGHLRDGYTIEELDELFNSCGFDRLNFGYNTGFPANIGCWLYYNKPNLKNKYLKFLKHLILLIFFKFFDVLGVSDIFNGPNLSCTLFAVYKKRGNNEK